MNSVFVSYFQNKSIYGTLADLLLETESKSCNWKKNSLVEL